MAVIHAPTGATAAPSVSPPPLPPPIGLLLVESQFLLRRTVAAVARDLRLADPQELTSVDAASRVLALRAFDALFLSLDEEASALALMARVRQGDTKCARGMPIAVMAAACSTALALRLKELEVRRLLLRPFKVKGVLEAISALRPEAAPASEVRAA